MAAKTSNLAKKPRISSESTAASKALSSSDKVVETILQRLLSGQFVPGQRLVEVELAGQCGVSRGSVREAFKRLSAQGIITLSPHRGACIRQLTRREVIDILQIQAALAGLGASLAAERIDEGDYRRQLEAVIAGFDRFRDNPAGVDYHRQRQTFYETMTEISGNRELMIWLPNVQIHLVRVHFHAGLSMRFRQRHFKDYRAIGEAILDGDRRKAERLTRRHIERVIDEMAKQPDDAIA
jgi:DNA-binding GntR family transcriptional regulator